MSSIVAKRSRTRRAGESAYGLLLLLKSALMALAAGLLLVAGVWTSWDTARPATFSGYERGTLVVASCGGEVCHGRFTSDSGAPPRDGVTVSASAADRGQSVPVALLPDTDDAVRTDPAGILYAWVPLAGALLLASLLVAGGLRMPRTAWAMALLGAGVMGATFALV